MWLGGRLVVLALTVVVWLQTAAVVAQAPASADDQEARTLFNLGREAYNEARYERALRYFRQAYDLSKRPGLLFNIASAADRLRRDEEALEAFRQYLAAVPDAENRAVVERRIAALEKVVTQTSEPEPAPALDPQAVARAAPEPEPAATSADYTEADDRADHGSSKSIVKRWWFWAGVGGVVAAGVIVGIAASSGGTETSFADAPVVDAQTRVVGL